MGDIELLFKVTESKIGIPWSSQNAIYTGFIRNNYSKTKTSLFDMILQFVSLLYLSTPSIDQLGQTCVTMTLFFNVTEADRGQLTL